MVQSPRAESSSAGVPEREFPRTEDGLGNQEGSGREGSCLSSTPPACVKVELLTCALGVCGARVMPGRVRFSTQSVTNLRLQTPQLVKVPRRKRNN